MRGLLVSPPPPYPLSNFHRSGQAFSIACVFFEGTFFVVLNGSQKEQFWGFLKKGHPNGHAYSKPLPFYQKPMGKSTAEATAGAALSSIRKGGTGSLNETCPGYDLKIPLLPDHIVFKSVSWWVKPDACGCGLLTRWREPCTCLACCMKPI